MAKLFASTIYRRPSLTFRGVYSAWFCSLDEIGSVRGSPGSLTPVSECCLQSPDCQSEYIRLRRTGMSGWVYTLNVSVQWWITDRENNSCLLSGADWPTVVYRNCLLQASDDSTWSLFTFILLHHWPWWLPPMYTSLTPEAFNDSRSAFQQQWYVPLLKFKWALSTVGYFTVLWDNFCAVYHSVPGLYRPYKNLAKSWVFVFVLLCLNRCIHLIEDFQSSMAHSSETLMV